MVSNNQNHINYNYMNFISNNKGEKNEDMELEENKNNISLPERTNSKFSNIFNEENQKSPKIKNPENIDNKFSYNIPFITNDINISNNLIPQNENKYPFCLSNKYDINILNSDNNRNQLKNLINLNNQSRFMNFFSIKQNEVNHIPSNIPFDCNRKHNNSFSIYNNITNNDNINNNINKKENNYIFENNNLSLNLNNNNIYNNYNDQINNVNYNGQINNISYNGQNKFLCTSTQNINNMKQLNINNINNNNIQSTSNNDSNINEINNIIIPNNILGRNPENEEFLNYVNNLNMPLIKFLSTKKGISEMENYLNNHKKNNIEILIKLLNKEGLTKLMKHKFGNYFIQEIIKDAKYPLIKIILELISQNFVEIAESNSGTHVLQTLLDKVNNFELRNIIIKSIENKELEMAFNSNATYVLQKIIGIIPDNERLNMNEIIINNLINLALDSDCVFIVEKFISSITIKENKNRIKYIICKNCIQLATSPFGNYLIQYLFQIWKNEDIEKINDIIIDNANFLAKQRYSSNVIEKAVDTYDSKIKPRLIRSLSLGGDILEIIKNQYGHYVLNKAVKFMDDKLKNEIETILTNQMPEMTKKEKTKSKKFIANLKKNGKNKKTMKNMK